MLRRILYLAFVLTLAGGVAYFYWSFQKKNNAESSFSEFSLMPNTTALVVTLNGLGDVQNELHAEGEMREVLRRLPFVQECTYTLDTLAASVGKTDNQSWLTDLTVHLAWSKHANDSFPLVLCKFEDQEKVKTAWAEWQNRGWVSGQELKIGGRTARSITVKGVKRSAFLVCRIENVWVVSAGKNNMQQSLQAMEEGSSLLESAQFMQVQQTAGNQSLLNVFVNLNQVPDLEKRWGSNAQPTAGNALGAWVALDLNLQEKAVMLNGFGSSSAQQSFFDVLQSMPPVKYTSPAVLPQSVAEFAVMGVADISTFREKFTAYQAKSFGADAYAAKLEQWNSMADTNLTLFFDGLLENEVCAVYQAQVANADSLDRLVVMKVKSGSLAEEAYGKVLAAYAGQNGIQLRTLQSNIQADYKTEVNSYHFPFDGVLQHLYGAAVKDGYLQRVCFYKNYMVVGYNHEALQNVIYENMRNRTLANDANYQEFSESIAEHANFFWFVKMPRWKKKLQHYLQPRFAEHWGAESSVWNAFYALGLQLSTLNTLTYSTAYIHYKPEIQEKPKTVWESKLKAGIQMKPVWVVNHNTGDKEVCVQDKSNTFYLISNKGIVLWEKKLDSPIVGTVEQLDYFKNGKLQLLFSTQNKLHLLDRNGNFVGRYPINFAAKTTVGASLQDYSGKKDYRIFVPCENGKIYLYDKRGQIVKGWNFDRTDHWVNQPVKHFRADNRDFIVFKDKSRLYIQDRRGKTRVKVKNNFTPAVNSAIYLDKNGKVGKERFVTTNEWGVVKFVYVDGTVREKKLLEATPQHTYAFVDVDGDGLGDHLFLDQGVLTVFTNDGTKIMEKAFASANLFGPAVYNFGPKNIKIGVTDIPNGRIYLFNSDGTTYEGFPVAGITDFSIAYQRGATGKFGLIVGGRNGYIMYYNLKQ